MNIQEIARLVGMLGARLNKEGQEPITIQVDSDTMMDIKLACDSSLGFVQADKDGFPHFRLSGVIIEEKP